MDVAEKKRALTLLQICVAIDMMGVGMVLPVMPEIATPAQMGLMGTFYGIGQLIGGPLGGTLSDKYGRKRILLFSFLDCLFSYGVMAIATSFPMLLACRVAVGLGKQTVSISQAYVTDLTTEEERMSSFARLATVLGIGFIVGPTIGAFLSSFHIKLPLVVSSFLFLIITILAAIYLPDPPHVQHPPKEEETSEPFVEKIKRLKSQLFSPVGHLLFIKFLYSAVHLIYQDTVMLFTKQMFKFDSKSNGPLLSYIGILSVLAQEFAVPLFHRNFKPKQSLIINTTLMGLFTIGGGASSGVVFFMIAVGGVSFFTGVFNTNFTSIYSLAVPVEQRGGYLGLSSSLDAVVRVAVPALSSIMFQVDPRAPFLFAGSVYLVLALYLKGSAALPSKPSASNSAEKGGKTAPSKKDN